MLTKKKLFFFFFLVFFFSLRAIFDGDLGLHLRIGEYIFKTRSLIYNNPFGLYFNDYPYVYHSWLSQLIIFLIYKISGLYGLNFFYALLSVLTIFVLHKICVEKGKAKDSLLILAFLTPFIVFISGLRTRAITFLFLGVLQLFLLKIEKGQKRLAFLIPFLFAFWVNLHGGFLMGLILLLLWIIFEIIQFKSPAKTLLLFKILIASILFCLFNPYGIGVYTQPLKMMTTPAIFKNITDWQPLSAHPTALLIGLVFVFLVFLFKNIISQKDQFLFFCMFFLAVFSSRFFLMVVFITLPLLVVMLNFIKNKSWFRKAIKSPLVLLSLTIFFLSIFLKQSFQILEMVWVYQSMENYASSLNPPIPYQAIEFIKEKNLSKKMLNDYNWGSFLLWQLPERKIFVDGRMDTFVIQGKPFLEDYLPIIFAEKGWKQLLEKYEIEVIFLEKKFPLAKILPLLPEWKKVYEDEMAVILTRNKRDDKMLTY